MNETHVNPDVAAGTSLNTKPVTKARAGAHGKSSKKLGNATAAPATVAGDAAKAAGMGAKAVKAVKAAAVAPADMVAGQFTKLDQWPANAGPAPTRYDIARAYCFTTCTLGRPSKKVLAAAAYLMPESLKVPVTAITGALAVTMGGQHDDDMRNVMTSMQKQRANGQQWVRKHSVKIDNVLAYHAEVTPQGEARWQAFVALHPAFDIENPYDAAVAKAAELKAKRDAAAAKAKATREAKGKAKQAPASDHVMPHHEAAPVTEAVEGNGGTPEAPNDESSQVST